MTGGSLAAKKLTKEYPGGLPPKGPASEAPAGPSQLDRVNAAIAHLPRFDKYWIEKAREILAEAQNGPPQGAADGSIDREAWTLISTLVKRANDWNLLRSHPDLPKSFVGEGE